MNKSACAVEAIEVQHQDVYSGCRFPCKRCCRCGPRSSLSSRGLPTSIEVPSFNGSVVLCLSGRSSNHRLSCAPCLETCSVHPAQSESTCTFTTLSMSAAILTLCTTLGVPYKYLHNFFSLLRLGVDVSRQSSFTLYRVSGRSWAKKFPRATTDLYLFADST